MLYALDRLLPWTPVITTIGLLLLLLFWRPPLSKKYVSFLVIIQVVPFFISLIIGYFIGREDTFQKYFYPPYSNNFLTQALNDLTTLTSGWVAAAILGLGLYLLFLRRGQEQFINHRDLWLIIIGAIAVGWPAVLVFLGYTFILSILGMIGLIILKKKTFHDRITITPFIIPSALVTLITGKFVLVFTNLIKISF